MSDEVLIIKDTVEQKRSEFKMSSVVHLSRWLDEAYGEEIVDTSSLARKFQTNQGYQTLKVPVKKVDDGYRVEVTARYLTEDVPFGLLVTKGIASAVGVETPMIDEVITKISAWIGKEYLIDGELVGRDVMTTRAPQRYGIDSLEELIRLET